MTGWSRLRATGGLVVLAALLWRFGSGPFVDAWHVTTWSALVAAGALTGLATATSAWRWRVVAGRLGVPLGARAALAAYYRSQLLNATLPGGVLGDAHRAVRHGRAVGDLGAGLRATVWERISGQVLQGLLLVTVLLVVPSPLRGLAPSALVVAALIVLLVWAVRRTSLLGGVAARDLRTLVVPGTVAPVALASVCSTGAHVAVFLVAAHAVGVEASWTTLLPLALLVLTASALPLSVAGWGPREGVTAWAFSVAGLGAGQGLTVSVVYGVLATAATLPGVVVLLADAVGHRGRRPAPPPPTERRALEEARHG
jgi:uncharacterized membrane protein YbhN (UPF0104 family)